MSAPATDNPRPPFWRQVWRHVVRQGYPWQRPDLIIYDDGHISDYKPSTPKRRGEEPT